MQVGEKKMGTWSAAALNTIRFLISGKMYTESGAGSLNSYVGIYLLTPVLQL